MKTFLITLTLVTDDEVPELMVADNLLQLMWKADQIFEDVGVIHDSGCKEVK